MGVKIRKESFSLTNKGKKMWNASRFCVSSLRRGHANLLCIVPILVYVLPKQVHFQTLKYRYIYMRLITEKLKVVGLFFFEKVFENMVKMFHPLILVKNKFF